MLLWHKKTPKSITKLGHLKYGAIKLRISKFTQGSTASQRFSLTWASLPFPFLKNPLSWFNSLRAWYRYEDDTKILPYIVIAICFFQPKMFHCEITNRINYMVIPTWYSKGIPRLIFVPAITSQLFYQIS